MFINKYRNRLNYEIFNTLYCTVKYVFYNSKYLYFIFILKLNQCTTALICISGSNRIINSHNAYTKKEKMLLV